MIFVCHLLLCKLWAVLLSVCVLCRHEAAVDDMHHELGTIGTVSNNLTFFVFV